MTDGDEEDMRLILDARRRLQQLDAPIKEVLGHPVSTPTGRRLKEAWEGVYEAMMRVEEIARHDTRCMIMDPLR